MVPHIHQSINYQAELRALWTGILIYTALLNHESSSRFAWIRLNIHHWQFAIQNNTKTFSTLEKNGTFPINFPSVKKSAALPRNNAESRLDSWVFNLRPAWVKKFWDPCSTWLDHVIYFLIVGRALKHLSHTLFIEILSCVCVQTLLGWLMAIPNIVQQGNMFEHYSCLM